MTAPLTDPFLDTAIREVREMRRIFENECGRPLSIQEEGFKDEANVRAPSCRECGAIYGTFDDEFNICPPCRAEYRRGER